MAQVEVEVASEQRHTGATCRRLRESVSMQLPQLVQRLATAARAAIDDDRHFGSQCEALVHLIVLDRLALQRDLGRGAIAELLDHPELLEKIEPSVELQRSDVARGQDGLQLDQLPAGRPPSALRAHARSRPQAACLDEQEHPVSRRTRRSLRARSDRLANPGTMGKDWQTRY